MARKNRTWVLYLLTALIPVLSIAAIMIIQGAYPFGEKTILYGDINQQIRYFVRNFCDIAENNNSLFYSWNGGMGYDFFSNFLYYLACPITWLVLLFGKTHVEAGLLCVLIIYVSLCGLSFLYFLRHSIINKLEKSIYSDLLCVVFALAYAMCDYNLAYRFNIMWMPCLILSPLVMLGVEKLVHEKKYGLYFSTLLMSFLFNFYFSWFVCILSVIWFIEQEKSGIKDFFKKVIRFAGISIMAAMSAAVVLFPALFSVLDQNRDSFSSLKEMGITAHASLGNFLQGFIWGNNISHMGYYQFTQNNYCGIFVFMLFILYIIIMDKNWQNIKRIILITVVSIGANVLCVSYILHGFSLPNGYNNRFVFILVILLIIQAFQAMCNIDKLKLIQSFILAAVIVAVLFIAMLNSTEMSDVIAYIVSFMLACYISVILILYVKGSIKYKAVVLNIIIIGFCEIFSNALFSNSNSSFINQDDNLKWSEWIEEYENIEVSGGNRKTTWVGGSIILNASDTDLFLSITNKGMADFLSKMGCLNTQTSVSYSIRGCTPLIATLFNVRYVLTDNFYEFGGFYQVQTFGSYYIAENTNIAGLGFMTDKNILNWDIDNGNAFDVQNEFVNTALNKEALFITPDLKNEQIYTSLCEITDYNNGVYKYVSTGGSDEICEIDYSVILPECQDLYFYLYNDYGYTYGIYLDGELIYNNSSSSLNDMVHIGYVEEDKELVICCFASIDSDVEHKISFSFADMNMSIFSECLDEMGEQTFNIQDFTDTYVRGTVNVKNSGILFTSIPYYKGFTAYVDGEKTDIIALHDALICLELDEGEHVVEFKYFPYGLKSGIIISCLGIIIYAGIMLIRKKKMKSIIKGID